jgi:hypothetical protein
MNDVLVSSARLRASRSATEVASCVLDIVCLARRTVATKFLGKPCAGVFGNTTERMEVTLLARQSTELRIDRRDAALKLRRKIGK